MDEIHSTQHGTKSTARVAGFFGSLPHGLMYLYLAFLSAALICVMLFSTIYDYSFYNIWVKEGNSPWILLIALSVSGLFLAAAWRMRSLGIWETLKDRKRFLIVTGVASVMLLLVQAWLVNSMGYLASADSGILCDVGQQKAYSYYYSYFPHNLFCEGVFTLITFAAHAVGADPHICLIAGGCFLTTAAIAFAMLTTHKLAGAEAATITFILGALWVGTAPIAQTPYTDSYGVIFPALLVYLYTCAKKPFFKWPLIIGVSVFGSFMKVTTLAVLGAIIFVEGCQCIQRALQREAAEREGTASGERSASAAPAWKKAAMIVLACVVAASASLGVCQAIKNVPDVVIDAEWELGTPHFLMMGMGATRGVFDMQVYEHSISYENKADRDAANLKSWQNRIVEWGPAGVADQLFSKMMTTYGNGSFFWGGDFIEKIFGDNAAVRDLYGLEHPIKQTGTLAPELKCPYTFFAQVIWTVILMGCILCFLRRHPSRTELVICVALLVYSAYLLIFETGPRYVFLYSSFFLILAPLGWRELACAVSSKWQSRKQAETTSDPSITNKRLTLESVRMNCELVKHLCWPSSVSAVEDALSLLL